ncbi:MAG: energy-coupling factor ABC transporter permease [Geobacteraceae bacterium]|nr:energy-coupling factor ABC transporter permease [Geobacteraceae bacterium]
MHMADALLSPAVGGTMWAASAGTIAYCSTRLRSRLDDRKVPLMGVLGAFIFAAQMINFSIPGTGSSGHLGGGLLLAILLGPQAAFLTIASVLVVQALFFADGGLLALGCNIFNLGFFPAFIAYPLIYKKIAGTNPGRIRLAVGAIVAAVAGLQMGAFGVVLETTLSGVSSLPFTTFLALMLPIHLAIGIVEGLVTATVLSFVYKARPEMLVESPISPQGLLRPARVLLLGFLAATLLVSGMLSWYASAHPDGLEWAIAKVTGKEEIAEPESGIFPALASLQQKTSFFPDYSLPGPAKAPVLEAGEHGVAASASAVDLGTSAAGIIGSLLTLAIASLVAFLLRKRPETA